MQAIIDTIVAFGNWILGLVKALITAVWDFVIDVVCFVLDQILSFVVTLLGGVNVGPLEQIGAWAGLPPELINMIGLIGLGQCMAIIAAAIAIRLTLQLIPFVRLGS